MKKERIVYLLNVYASGHATDAEQKELMDWMLEADSNESIKEMVLQLWNQNDNQQTGFSYVNWDEIYEYIINNSVKGVPSIHFAERKTRKLYWIAVAASVLLILSLAAYQLFFVSPQTDTIAVRSDHHDVAPPVEDKAVLILSDGSSIVMDSASQGIIATQGEVRIVKSDKGTISYLGKGGKEVSYNTFRVPRGSRPLSLILADGSKVWINVGSSLTFPTAFNGREREVKMTGEAYFEVVHNAVVPFKVRNGDVTINVLGTHFNVNAYKDEQVEKITLLEGAVLVNRKSDSKTLQPGQQAIVPVKASENMVIHRNIDLNEVLAWRDGKFVFNQNMDIHDIMRQLSRWYDVDVEYQGVITQRFWGTISKDVNLSQVLKILEATGGVKFEIEDDKVIVSRTG